MLINQLISFNFDADVYNV